MNIVVINASPSIRGAVSTLVESTSRAATAEGATVEHIRLAGCTIGFCRFCLTCYRDTDSEIGTCVQEDDMGRILPKLRAADGYIMGTQVSSGHANAIFKTFFERCVFTAGSSKGKILWIKGVPTTRFTDRRRFAVTVATAGSIPASLRFLCDEATRQMKELAKYAFNAKVVGTLYVGELKFKGLQEKDLFRADRLGRRLVTEIRRWQEG